MTERETAQESDDSSLPPLNALTLNSPAPLATNCVLIGHCDRADVVWTGTEFRTLCEHMLNGNSQTDFMLVYRDQENRPKFAKANRYATGRAIRQNFLRALNHSALKNACPKSVATSNAMPENQDDFEDDAVDFDDEDEPKRTSRPGVRHRRDNKLLELIVKPVPAPDPKQLGTLTRWTEEILAGGPRALIAAEHKAAKLAEKFGVEIEAQWCLTTPYLTKLKVNNPRAAFYAIHWRPRYLAVLSLSRSDIFACRAAKIARMTPLRHRKDDPEFDLQCQAAEEHAIELLHDVTMKSAIEGECEPVFWQGIEVGHIRKVDNRLRIEMLRARMPKTFKTPGSKIDISTGNTQNNNMFICGPAEVAQLVALRQEALKKIAEQRANALPAVTVAP